MPRWSTFIPYPPRVTTDDSGEVPGISPKQAAFLLLDESEALYGGSAGGGKSEALLQGATQDVDDWPTSSLLLRRTYRDLDKPGGLMFRARQWFTGTKAHWDGINYRWVFPSGATVNFGYLDHEGDELKFQSSEYQYIGFDELTHFPRHQYLYLFSRLRRLKGTPVPLRMRSGTNPGGPGHEWVRKRWSLPGGPSPGSERVFVAASLDDNPFLEQEEYKRGLEQLGDVTRAQLLAGDWSATSTGGYFQAGNFRLCGWDEVPEAKDFAAIVRYWDFAATEPSEMNPDPDYTVGLKLGMTHTGAMDPTLPDWYVLDVERFRGNPGTVENTIKAVAQRDGPRVVQWLEQERGSAGKHLYRHYAVTVLPEYTVRSLYATGTKEARAAIAAARANEGRIFLVDGPWIDDFVAECAVFPLGSHDDQVDGLSNAMISSDRERIMGSSGAVIRRGKELQPVRRVKNRAPRGRHLGY
jgi:predicted phage terminase large subunit-like protein